MKNEGKKFEEDLIKSLPSHVFRLRLNDGGGWSDGENTRFTPSNICDFIIGYRGKHLLLELKSHKGKSIPFSCLKQLPKLASIEYDDTIPLFAFNFRTLQETYLIPVLPLSIWMDNTDRKSVPVEVAEMLGIQVSAHLVRVRYRYDLIAALDKIIK